MLRNTALSIAALLLTAATASAQPQVTPAWLTLPQHSVASTDDALSLLVNPAGLGVQDEGSAYFLAPYQSNAHFEDWGLVMGENLGFAMETYRHDPTGPRRRYTWGLGFGEEGTYFGFAYSWTTGIDRQNTWDLGVLERPFRFLSVGAVARGVNEPQLNGIKQPVGWDLGAGFRPLAAFGRKAHDGSDRLTITADAYLRGYDEIAGLQPKQGYFDNVDTKFGAAVEIVPGVTGHLDFQPKLRGVAAHDSRIWGGFTFSFGHVELGGYQASGNGNGVGYIVAREDYHKTLLKRKHKKFVEIKLEGPVVETQPSFFLFNPHYRTIKDFHDQLQRYQDDPEIAGVLLNIGDVQAGWGKMQEMRAALADFKAKDKKIAAYMESAGNGEYYLASVADKIYLPPASDIDLIGLRASSYYLHGTLAKIGVEPEMAHIGAYKSASDMLTRENMSDAEREATGAILDDIYGQFTTDIAAGRRISAEDTKTLIDRGPFTSQQARKEGLVDSLIYEDQVNDLVKSLGGDNTEVVSEEEHDLNNFPKLDWDDSRVKSVAIVYGVGDITSGESSEGGLFGGETMGSASIAKALKDAREDEEVAAVVFRVDSPGGSALASDLIMREVKRYRDDKKPIIVSMSDVAGSGGYYVACMADTIVALPGTITGSIGVIGGKFSFGALEKKIGLGSETISRGKFADFYSSDRTFTDEEWERLRDQIGETYRIFLNRVSEGRGMDTAAVNKIAQGRIWSGEAAKKNGLVDVNGGLDTAIKLAATAGGIKEGEKYEVENFTHHGEVSIGMGVQSAVRSALPGPILRLADRTVEQTRWRDGDILMLMPFDLDIH